MKLLYAPIKLAAVFYPEGGIAPIGFVYQNRKYSITLIKEKRHSFCIDYGAMTKYLVQVVGPNGDERMCELVFYSDKMRWVLLKF